MGLPFFSFLSCTIGYVCDTPEDAASLEAEHTAVKAFITEHSAPYHEIEALAANLTASGSTQNP
jgi:hypothetical protein